MTLVELAPAAGLQFTHGSSYAGAPSSRPMLEVELAAVGPSGVLLGKPLRTTVLVDSGADVTMLDGGLASTLGIDLRACPQGTIGGVGVGGVPVASSVVKMRLCNRWVDVPVDFTLNPIQTPQLLGRSGAFDGITWAFVHNYTVVLALAV